MFTNLYNFFFEWLYNGTYPTFISEQSAELTCVLFCVITIVALIKVALIPIKAIMRIGGI